MRYLRLWITFFKNCLTRELEFRSNFFIQIIGNVIELLVTIVFFKVIYLHISTIGGWGIYETLFLVGTNQLITNLHNAFFGLNIPRISEYTRSGNLDLMLIKPIDTQFFVSCRYINFASLMSIIFPLFLLYYVVINSNFMFSSFLVFLYLLLIFCGVLIRYTIGFGTMILSFWVTRIEALYSLYSDFFSLAGYPSSIYQGVIRIFFIFIIPLIVVANFPVMIAIKLLNPIYTLYALLISVLFFTFSRILFKFALRCYSSASS